MKKTLNYLGRQTFMLAACLFLNNQIKSQAPCVTPFFQDNFNSSAGWTSVDPANGNGTIDISAGEMHMHNPECNPSNTNGVHNNREVRLFRPLPGTLSNNIWRAECRLRISDGNGVSHTFMGFTAGSLCPQGVITGTPGADWGCSGTGGADAESIDQTSNQDGIFASLIAFGYSSNSGDPNNQIPNNDNDQSFNSTVQADQSVTPAKIGWRIYGHAINGLSSLFGTTVVANNPAAPPINYSRGIALPNTGTNYWVRLERLSPTNCRISVFSNAGMTTHVPGSPQCFLIQADVENLTTIQNFAHISGSKFRRVRGEVDDITVFNNCSAIPTLTATASNTLFCAGNTVTLTATPGFVSYTWTAGSSTVTSTNTLAVSPNGNTTYTVSASFTTTDCPIQTTVNVTLNPNPVLTPSVSLTSTVICSGSPINATGYAIGNLNCVNHYWEIIESDAQGVPVASPTYSYSGWFSGSPGFFNFPNGTQAPCNKYYSIKLALQNLPCVTWSATNTVIYVSCTPTPVISGPTLVCYGSTATLCSNYMPAPNYSLSWSPAKSGTTQCIALTRTTTTTFTLLVTNQYGCSGVDYHVLNVDVNNPNFGLGGYLNPGSPSYTATAVPLVSNALSNPNFGYAWFVDEIDPITGAIIPNTSASNPSCWWSYGVGPNQFSGYVGTNIINCGTPPVGEFITNKKYKITRGTWITGSCPWIQVSKAIHLCDNCRTANGKPVFTIEDVFDTPDYSGKINSSEMKMNSMTIYPNPSNGIYNLSIESFKEAYTLEVYDAMGRKVKSQTIDKANAEINISNLEKGIYLVKAFTGGEVIVKSIIKE
ncbi:MAG: hypothetical protein K0S32_1314 [Bacteroidetes bacterium]|jgi:hypothetical protein|nr:hypothetical protein [Bacteroidota bacterium]